MRRWVTFVSALIAGAALIVPSVADDLAACRDRATAPDDAIAACGRLLAASPAGAEPATAPGSVW